MEEVMGGPWVFPAPAPRVGSAEEKGVRGTSSQPGQRVGRRRARAGPGRGPGRAGGGVRRRQRWPEQGWLGGPKWPPRSQLPRERPWVQKGRRGRVEQVQGTRGAGKGTLLLGLLPGFRAWAGTPAWGGWVSGWDLGEGTPRRTPSPEGSRLVWDSCREPDTLPALAPKSAPRGALQGCKRGTPCPLVQPPVAPTCWVG